MELTFITQLLSATVLLLLLVVFILSYRIKTIHIKRNEELKLENRRIVLEQEAFHAMINPHFIFNVLNSIQHYINNNNAYEANLYLSDFARYIRTNLEISSKKYISLDEEIAFLELFVSLERLRFEKKLTYEVYVDPAIDTDETVIPAMLLQPFIENALWHGILPVDGKGHLKLSIKKEAGNMLSLEITDDGEGHPPVHESNEPQIRTRDSKGILITRQRLEVMEALTGRTLSLKINKAFPGQKNEGTRVALSIPGDLT